MAGLMNAGPAASQAPVSAQSSGGLMRAPETPGPQEEESSNVSPEEQAQYDKFMNNALEIIFPQGEEAQVSEAVLNDLSGKPDPEAAQLFAEAQPPLEQSPIDNLASSTVQIVLMLEGSAQQSGAEIADDVVFHAGKDILEHLAEVAEAAGIYDYQEEEMEGAFFRALDLYRISSPRVDQQALTQEFQQIQRADQDGSLSQLLPGIDQVAG